jgi:hypothetical protein
MSYAAMINSAMLLVILLTDMDKYGIKIPVAAYFFQIMIVGVILMILWGYLEDKLGMWRYEQAIQYNRSEIITSISSRINLIDKKINQMIIRLSDYQIKK